MGKRSDTEASLQSAIAKWRIDLAEIRDPAARLHKFEEHAKSACSYIALKISKAFVIDRLFDLQIQAGLDNDAAQAALDRVFLETVEPPKALEVDGGGEPEVEPKAKPNGKRKDGHRAVLGLGAWNAGTIDLDHIPPREWYLGNHFCRGFVSVLFAAGGVGKSALRLAQYVAMALEQYRIVNQHPFGRFRVLLISFEDNDNEVKRRLKALLLYHEIAQPDLDGWLYIKCLPIAKLAKRKGRWDRAIGELEQQIRNEIELLKPDLVALDPFVKLHELAENDTGDMDFVAGLLVKLAIEKNLAVDTDHHVHKGNIEPGDADAGRGASSIRDAGRLVYTLTVMSETEARNFDVRVDERLSYIRLDPAKVNIAGRGRSTEWFQLVGQPLGNPSEKYPKGDTVQVCVPWKPPEIWVGLSNEVLNRILDAIDRGICNETGPTGERYSAANAAGKRAVWKVVQTVAAQFGEEKTDKQCKEIIKAWLASKLLEEEQYESPGRSEPVKGLKVNSAKRPGRMEDCVGL